jgi:hypothetical protein
VVVIGMVGVLAIGLAGLLTWTHMSFPPVMAVLEPNMMVLVMATFIIWIGVTVS